MKKSLSNIPPELILLTMSFMKSKDITEYCKINPYINNICIRNNDLIKKYGLMNDLEITKEPSKNVLKFLIPYSDNIKRNLYKIFEYAAGNDRVDVISFLMENGVEPSNYDKIVYKAIDNDSVNVFKYVLDKMIKYEIEENGEYDEDDPFDFDYFLTVFFSHKPKIIDYLIRYRSSMIMTNINNFIELLSEKGDWMIANYLKRIRSGEDIKFADYYRDFILSRNSDDSDDSLDSSLDSLDSISGGSSDASLQKRLLQNIQKEYGIRLPLKGKKSKSKSKKKIKRKSPLKYEIKDRSTQSGSGSGETRSRYYGIRLPRKPIKKSSTKKRRSTKRRSTKRRSTKRSAKKRSTKRRD